MSPLGQIYIFDGPKSNQIKSNQIELNRIKSNRIKSNQIILEAFFVRVRGSIPSYTLSLQPDLQHVLKNVMILLVGVFTSYRKHVIKFRKIKR